jgi:hypothetical protein
MDEITQSRPPISIETLLAVFPNPLPVITSLFPASPPSLELIPVISAVTTNS